MAKPLYTVTLLVGPNCFWEAEAIGQVLEGFNLRVIKYNIGRPSDFINFINGNDVLIKSDFIIFSFHGESGKFIMPKLESSLYKKDEPSYDLGPKDIDKYFCLKDTFVINTACTLGNQEMASSFLDNGCKTYIGPSDYVDGNSSLFFVIRFFYEMINNHKESNKAFEVARLTDCQTQLFKLFR